MRPNYGYIGLDIWIQVILLKHRKRLDPKFTSQADASLRLQTTEIRQGKECEDQEEQPGRRFAATDTLRRAKKNVPLEVASWAAGETDSRELLCSFQLVWVNSEPSV